MKRQTKESINEYGKRYDTTKDFDRYFIDFRFRCLSEHYPKFGDVLELGCANGLMTKRLLEVSKKLDVVEGSEHYIRETKKYLGAKARQVHFFHEVFPDFMPDKKYDTIIMSSILHEVDDPVNLLKRAKKWLKPSGLIYANVPNAISIHRRLGRIMGFLKNEYAFNERDKTFLHQRIYDLKKLSADVKKAGLRVKKQGGFFLKVVSNGQMEKWDPKLLDALYLVSKEIPPEFCAEIYIFAGI